MEHIGWCVCVFSQRPAFSHVGLVLGWPRSGIAPRNWGLRNSQVVRSQVDSIPLKLFALTSVVL